MGNQLSNETKFKISKALSGIVRTDEFKKKLSLANLGRVRGPMSQAHKDKIKEANKKFWSTHPPQTGEKCSAWKGGITKHPNYYTHVNKLRKDRLLGAIGTHSIYEWELLKKQYGFTCPCCHKKLALVKDHIIPLSKGGSNFIENIQPLCRSCNAKKYTKSTKYFFEAEIIK